ncbi:ATP-binding protein [Pontivivens nitratireducens]|uniref:ATP-binding protein n=1 Tax=Pontivivens nitratireducens TaxID=2758038 RepID=UPI001639FAB7|nr:ATP-binding protein [Pontibrevibacter nitratireducens]
MIENLSEADLIEVLSKNFTPSSEIKDPKRLIGRQKNLKNIRRALSSESRHVFIYGERGVGKTSLAVTAAHMCVTSPENFIYIPCGEETTFLEAI